jgi:hypothetical protein
MGYNCSIYGLYIFVPGAYDAKNGISTVRLLLELLPKLWNNWMLNITGWNVINRKYMFHYFVKQISSKGSCLTNETNYYKKLSTVINFKFKILIFIIIIYFEFIFLYIKIYLCSFLPASMWNNLSGNSIGWIL